jgi:hypothetical protein
VAEPKPAGDFLRDILKQAGTEQGAQRLRTRRSTRSWSNLRPHCQVVGCRAGKLTLEVDSAPLFAELSGFRREEIRLASTNSFLNNPSPS